MNKKGHVSSVDYEFRRQRAKRIEQAAHYLIEKGRACSIAEFDRDHAPHGPDIRRSLLKKGLTHEEDGNVSIYPPHGEVT